MLATIILLLSVLLLVQFAFYAWRAAISSTAAAPLSEQMQEATGLPPTGVRPEDFRVIASFHSACPPLNNNGTRSLTLVQVYYHSLRLLCKFGPAQSAPWAQREMAVCARFAAVCLDERLRRNHAWLMELRS
jgi:hypothetical protein